MLQNFREALLLMCWLTSNYSSESIRIAENPSPWLLLLQNAMEMSSQLYIIVTLGESQVPHGVSSDTDLLLFGSPSETMWLLFAKGI